MSFILCSTLFFVLDSFFLLLFYLLFYFSLATDSLAPPVLSAFCSQWTLLFLSARSAASFVNALCSLLRFMRSALHVPLRPWVLICCFDFDFAVLRLALTLFASLLVLHALAFLLRWSCLFSLAGQIRDPSKFAISWSDSISALWELQLLPSFFFGFNPRLFFLIIQ